MTEAEMLALLRARYSRRVLNGTHPVLRYVGAAHVRYGPLWPRAIADFLVMDTWGNYGPTPHPLLGFEVKVSRADYLREVRDPAKSHLFRQVCSEWYVVVPDRAIVRDDLPDGWGLLAASGPSPLRCWRRPTVNPEPTPMPRGLIAGFLRAAATQARAPHAPEEPPDA